MKPYLDDGDVQLYHGDVINTLRSLPAGIAQTCVTSPPYWGLRDYGTGEWTGGDEACDHRIDARPFQHGEGRQGNAYGTPPGGNASRTATYADVCGRCCARRVDSQLGLEATPTLYVERMVAVFREVWRVLRDDATVWLNLGDSYAHGQPGGGSVFDNGRTDGRTSYEADKARGREKVATLAPGLKPKDLVGIPWRVAFALQTDGWYLRSDIVWSKPNPMPESVSDRPTKAHEYLFLLSKRPRYFYDADAIREPAEPRPQPDPAAKVVSPNGDTPWLNNRYAPGASGYGHNSAGRNRRSVWTIPTEPFPEAHFATYPQALVRPCILAGSRPGDTILDPFIGSGTTALVARNHARRCIGIDLSAEYLAIAARRLQQLSLLGGAA